MPHLYHALIIEDDPNSSDILKELLSSEAIDCTTVLDSRLIPQVMNKLIPPDVIFLDLEMPHLNGYEVIDLLKSIPEWAAIPVVACTVHLNEVHTARSKDFHSFIVKPIDMDTFPDQVRRILDNEPVWDIGRLR